MRAETYIKSSAMIGSKRAEPKLINPKSQRWNWLGPNYGQGIALK